MTLNVSDHALVRFLERAGCLDVEAVRQALAQSLQRAADSATELGINSYVITADGLSYVVREGTVTTIVTGSARIDGGRG